MAVSDAPTEDTTYRVLSRFKTAVIAIGLVMAAFAMGTLLQLLTTLVPGTPTGTVGNLLDISIVASSSLGMIVVGFAYLQFTPRGKEYIDLSRPTWKTAKYTASGTAAVLLVYFALMGLVQVSGLSMPVHPVEEMIGSDLQMYVLFLVVVFLFVAPGEEFLFRNVIQKRLGETFTVYSAILVTSLLYALMHLPGYMQTMSQTDILVSVVGLFGTSVVFGGVYAYTGELLVVIVAHALYNVVSFSLYVLPEVL